MHSLAGKTQSSQATCARHESAFTLVEILVVIAILTILLTFGVRFLHDTGPQARRATTDVLTSLIEQARTTAITTRSHIVLAIAPPGSLPADDNRTRLGLLKVESWPSDTSQAIPATLLSRWSTASQGAILIPGIPPDQPQTGDIQNPLDTPTLKLTFGSGPTTLDAYAIAFTPRGSLIYPTGSGPVVLRIAEGFYQNNTPRPSKRSAGGYSENILKIGRVTARPYPAN